MEISSHLCQWVSCKTKPNDGSFLTCLTPPDPDTSFPTLSEEMVNQMTAVEIKEDKRTKLLNWGSQGSHEAAGSDWSISTVLQSRTENTEQTLVVFYPGFPEATDANRSCMSLPWGQSPGTKRKSRTRMKPVTSLSVEEMLSSSCRPPTLPCVTEFLWVPPSSNAGVQH